MISVFDITLLSIVGLFAVRGLIRGVIKEFFTLLNFIIALLATVLYNDAFISFLQEHLGEQKWLPSVSFALCFFGILLVLTIIESIIYRFMQTSIKGEVSGIMGFILGIIEGAIFSSVIIWLLSHQSFFDHNVIFEGSIFTPLLVKLNPLLNQLRELVP